MIFEKIASYLQQRRIAWLVRNPAPLDPGKLFSCPGRPPKSVTIKLKGQTYRATEYIVNNRMLRKAGIPLNKALRFSFLVHLFSASEYQRLCLQMRTDSTNMPGEMAGAFAVNGGKEIEAMYSGLSDFLSMNGSTISLPETFTLIDLMHEFAHGIWFSLHKFWEDKAQAEFLAQVIPDVAQTLKNPYHPNYNFYFGIAQKCHPIFPLRTKISEYDQYSSKGLPNDMLQFASEVFAYGLCLFLGFKEKDLGTIPPVIKSFFEDIQLKTR